MAQDSHQRAKERFEDAREAWGDNHRRMREDLAFSNPADPKQWDDAALKSREGRPALTFDRTNQFIRQITGDARQNKPSLVTMPADSKGDPDVAQKLNGLLKHIEYTSRATHAYDTALDHAARCGVGWMRVLPEVVHEELNAQEVRIARVHDPLSCFIDPDSVEPDGSDATEGWVISPMTERAFAKRWPKAKAQGWKADGEWFQADGSLLVCEYQYVTETKVNRIVIEMPDGQQMTIGEDEFHKLARQIGFQPRVVETFESVKRQVKWCHLNGVETLEETDFPAQWIGMIPVYGEELWIDGKRHLCGMTRQLMAAQQFTNFELSAMAEVLRNQPKAPFMAPWEAIQQHEEHWKDASAGGNPFYLPYNAYDDQQRLLPPPQRQGPPMFPSALAQSATMGAQLMESAVGMFKANLGQQGNETSGKAIRARQQEGDTATFHYPDNQARSMGHLGRVVLDMIPRLYDTKRSARIMGTDDEVSFVEIDTQMQQAVRKDGRKVIAINPSYGRYDLRVTVGPAYTTVREQAAENLVQLGQANPQLAAALAPMLVKLRDMPEAEKIARVALALLPPPVQQAYSDDEDGPPAVPPQLQGQMQAMQQQLQEAQQLVRNLAQQLDEAQTKLNDQQGKLRIEAYKAETERAQAVQMAMTPEQVQALVLQTLQQLASPDTVSQPTGSGMPAEMP